MPGSDGPDKTEKITINLGLVDLGEIDLLVQEGFYANRTDFIRTALQLGSHHLSRRHLEVLRQRGETTELRVLGLGSIADDVTPELALATITHVEVLGAFRAPAAVRAALRSRTV
jgi:Arc/MetJ-type ribon-helix-helix transcriptional regulator